MNTKPEGLPDLEDFQRFTLESRISNELTTRLENGHITLNLQRTQLKITPCALIELLGDKFKQYIELPSSSVVCPVPHQNQTVLEHMRSVYKQLDRCAEYHAFEKIACGKYHDDEWALQSCRYIHRIRFLEWERELVYAHIEEIRQELQTKKESEIVTIKKEYEERLEVEKTELKETVNLREKEIRGRMEYERRGEEQNKYQAERIRELSKNVEVTYEKKRDVEKQLSILQIEHSDQKINIDKLKQELNQAQDKLQKVTKERDDARRKVLVPPTKTALRLTNQSKTPDTNQQIIDLITDSEEGLTFEEISDKIEMLDKDLYQLLGIMVQNGEIYTDERRGEILRYIPP